MTEKEFKTTISTAIKNCINDTELQKKIQLQQEQKTLGESIYSLESELKGLIESKDYENASTKETELIATKKKLDMVTKILNTYGDDVNLFEIDYEGLKDIRNQVKDYYMPQIKEKYQALDALLVQADAIRSEIKEINKAANSLFNSIIAAHKNPLHSSYSSTFNFMEGKESEALNILIELAKKYSE